LCYSIYVLVFLVWQGNVGAESTAWREGEMGLARFIAKDPYRPAETEQELDELLSEMDGVLDWTIHAGGDVTVEYERHHISDDLIEEALDGLGFELTHIYDQPAVDEAEAREVLIREE